MNEVFDIFEDWRKVEHKRAAWQFFIVYMRVFSTPRCSFTQMLPVLLRYRTLTLQNAPAIFQSFWILSNLWKKNQMFWIFYLQEKSDVLDYLSAVFGNFCTSLELSESSTRIQMMEIFWILMKINFLLRYIDRFWENDHPVEENGSFLCFSKCIHILIK